MARRQKREKKLTVEERLEQALVPAEEQPYSVPENWCWTYIKSAYEVTSSKRVHKEDWLSEGIPFYRTRELVKLSNQGYVDNELFISDELYRTFKATYGVPQIGDLLISGVGTIGIPYIIDSENPFYFKDGNVIWLKSKQLLNPKYTYYLYKSNYMDNMIHSMSSGTTVDTYTIVNANATPIPLPPSHEQQRIVDRIENLFAKLDEAKEKAQAVVDGFEARKAAILHKAFTGELTEKWRQENGITLDNWNLTSLSEVVSDFKYGTSEKSDYNNSGMPVFRIPNVTDGELDFSDMKYLKDWSIFEESQIHENDILIIRSNGSRNLVGKSVLVPKLNQPYAYASFLIRIRVTEKILPEYLVRYLNSSDGRCQMFNKAKSSAGINNINSKELGAIILRLPTIYEQKKIVGIIDSLFIKEQQAKETAEAVLDQIEAMKKSILARAFRGELGTNDPAEESAVEMLRQVL